MPIWGLFLCYLFLHKFLTFIFFFKFCDNISCCSQYYSYPSTMCSASLLIILATWQSPRNVHPLHVISCSCFAQNEVFCPERLMMSILTQIHYMPDHWKGRAHTSHVRDEFAMLFQYKVVSCLLSYHYFIFEWLIWENMAIIVVNCGEKKNVEVLHYHYCFVLVRYGQ